jgi:hypothetical protein
LTKGELAGAQLYGAHHFVVVVHPVNEWQSVVDSEKPNQKRKTNDQPECLINLDPSLRYNFLS